jgi:hypothetical protein
VIRAVPGRLEKAVSGSTSVSSHVLKASSRAFGSHGTGAEVYRLPSNMAIGTCTIEPSSTKSPTAVVDSAAVRSTSL